MMPCDISVFIIPNIPQKFIHLNMYLFLFSRLVPIFQPITFILSKTLD